MTLFRATRGAALCASALWLGLAIASLTSSAQAGDLGLRPTQSANATPPEKNPEPAQSEQPADTIDWNAALNYDPATLSSRTFAAPAPTSNWNWDRTTKNDGTATVTAKRALPTEWDSKVGVDMTSVNPQYGAGYPIDPSKLLPGASSSNASDGAAWASVTAPSLNAPVGWDKATIDARFDPQNDERKLGTTISKSVPLNDNLSVTLQNGYSMTQSQTTITPVVTVPGTLATAHTYSTHSFNTDNTAKLNLLPTGTSLSVGTTMSTADEKWLHSIGAEQKLFDGISIKGKVSETVTGVPDRSISAGFTKTW